MKHCKKVEKEEEKMKLKEKIKCAKNLNEMNSLREEIVKANDREILLIWQRKYSNMRICSKCGKVL